MDLLSALGVFWSLFKLIFGFAFFWGLGLAAYLFVVGYPVCFIYNHSPRLRLCRDRWFTRIFTALAVIAAAFFCISGSVSLQSVAGLILPAEDIEALFGVTESHVLINSVKRGSTTILIDYFSTPETYCTLFGAAMIMSLHRLLRFIFGDGEHEKYDTIPLKVRSAILETILSAAAVLIAFAFAEQIRDVLAAIVTWGTGTFYSYVDGTPIALKILYYPFIIAFGALLIGIFFKEVTGNSFIAVLLGCIISYIFLPPVFSGDTARWGYIIGAVVYAFLLRILGPVERKRLSRRIRLLEEKECRNGSDKGESFLGEYLYNGISFAHGVVSSAIFSYLFLRFLA